MELNKRSEIAQEKLTLTRRELQEVVILTSKFTTQLGVILTSKDDHLINSFAITTPSITRANCSANVRLLV